MSEAPDITSATQHIGRALQYIAEGLAIIKDLGAPPPAAPRSRLRHEPLERVGPGLYRLPADAPSSILVTQNGMVLVEGVGHDWIREGALIDIHGAHAHSDAGDFRAIFIEEAS